MYQKQPRAQRVAHVVEAIGVRYPVDGRVQGEAEHQDIRDVACPAILLAWSFKRRRSDCLPARYARYHVASAHHLYQEDIWQY